MRGDAETAFRDYVEATKVRHFRMARLMCGSDQDAEDLVQHALIQLYLRWSRITRQGSPDAYVRKTITNKLIDLRRSAYSRHEERRAETPDMVSEQDCLDELVALRHDLAAALEQVPEFERAVVVLRWYEQLTVEETADLLNCSTARVKRATSAGLNRMRRQLASGNRHD